MKTKGKSTELSKVIGKKLYDYRKAHKITQRDFAELFDISFQQYQKYEKGVNRLSLESAIRFCEQTGESLDFFMVKGK